MQILRVFTLFSAEVDVEGLKQFSIFILWRNDADKVTQLRTQNLKGVLIQGLGGCRHLPQVEQNRDKVSGVDVDLLGEVGEGCTLANLHLLVIATRYRHAANCGRRLLLKLLTLCSLRLAALLATTATTTECAWCSTATAAATTARRRGETTGSLPRSCSATTGASPTKSARATAWACAAWASSATTAGASGRRSLITLERGRTRHHSGVRTRSSTGPWSSICATRRPRSARTRRTATGSPWTGHALA